MPKTWENFNSPVNSALEVNQKKKRLTTTFFNKKKKESDRMHASKFSSAASTVTPTYQNNLHNAIMAQVFKKKKKNYNNSMPVGSNLKYGVALDATALRF